MRVHATPHGVNGTQPLRSWQILLLSALLLAAATPARANGAMSLALSTFGWSIWLIYVAVTVLVEAIALSRILSVPFWRALRVSIGANALTAILGGFVSGIIGYGFYGVFGTRLDPNPFFQTLYLFTLFGIGSSLIEGEFWHNAAFPSPWSTSRWKAYSRSLAVHLAVIPVGLAILLSPPHPYGGLEGQVFYHRTWQIEQQLTRGLNDYLAEHEALPKVKDYEELLSIMQPYLKGFENEPDLWAAAYVPSYSRFDTGQSRRGQKWEWNSAASGVRMNRDKPSKIWITRVQIRDWCEGLELDGSQIHRMTGCTNLGYTSEESARD